MRFAISCRAAIIIAALFTAATAHADDGDDDIRASADKVRGVWERARSLSAFHSARDSVSFSLVALQRNCELYAGEFKDRNEFLARNARAEDDAYAAATNALRPLESSPTSGQAAAVRALRDRIAKRIDEMRQLARTKREDYRREFDSRARELKAVILSSDPPPRARDVLENIGYLSALRDARASIDSLFDSDVSRLQSPQNDRLRAAMNDALGPFKSLIDSEQSEAARDVEAIRPRDNLDRCWVE